MTPALYFERRKKDLCVCCTRPAAGHARCTPCQVAQRARARRWRAKRAADGECLDCKDPVCAESKWYCADCLGARAAKIKQRRRA